MRLLGVSFLARAFVLPVTAVATFLTVYLVIQGVGAEGYALVALISTLALLVPFADLGLGAVVVNAVASSARTGDGYRDRIIAAAVHWLVLSGIAIASVALLGASVFSWSDVIGGDIADADARTFDLATMLALVIFACSLPVSIGQRLLVGVNLTHVYVLVSASSSLLALGISAVALWSDAPNSLVWFAIALPVGSFVTASVSTAIGVRRANLSLRVFLRWSRIPPALIFSTAAPMFVIMVGLPLALQSHRILLAWRGTSADLAEYSMAMQLYAPLWSVIAAGAAALWPLFTHLRTTGADHERLWRQAAVVLAIAGTTMGAALAIGGPWASALVSAGAIDLAPLTALAAGALLLVQALQQLPGMFLTSPAGLRFQAACVAVLAAIVPMGSWLLIPIVGASGPLLVMAAAVLLLQLIPGVLRARLQPRILTPRSRAEQV